jgi:hypothetical protein
MLPRVLVHNVLLDARGEGWWTDAAGDDRCTEAAGNGVESIRVSLRICAPAGLKLEPAATASSDISEHDLKTSLRNIFSKIDSQRASAARNVCFKKDPQLNSYLHNFFRRTLSL